MKIQNIISKLMFALLAVTLISCGTSKKGQAQETTPVEQKRQNPRGNMNKGDMFASLNMSDSQAANFKQVKDKYKKEFEAARPQRGADRSAMKEKMDSIVKRENAEIQNILSPAQFKTYLEIQEKNKPKGPPSGGRGRG